MDPKKNSKKKEKRITTTRSFSFEVSRATTIIVKTIIVLIFVLVILEIMNQIQKIFF